jgi:beta-mannosidase
MLPLLLPRNENTLTFMAGPFSTYNEIDGEVKVTFVSIETGRSMHMPRVPIQIAANGMTMLPPGGWYTNLLAFADKQRPDEPLEVAKQNPPVIHATLYVNDERVVEDVAWPEPIKYLNFKDRGVVVRIMEEIPGDGVVFVSANKPAKGFVFDEREGVQLSDNGFDLVPEGRTKTVIFKGCESSELTWRYVGMEVPEELVRVE